MITKDKHVTVSYVLRSQPDAPIIEQTTPDNPLAFIFGAGMMLEHFEKNLMGLNKGDKFAFGLTPEQAYGTVDPNLFVELPKEAFAEVPAEMLAIDAVFPLKDSMDRVWHGRVTAIDDNKVTLDLNHKMAGQSLYFTGEVLEERDATEEELKALRRNCGGCSHDCSDCGGSCDCEK